MSSKNITADSITSRRCDFKCACNNVNIISYDIKDGLKEIEISNSDLVREKQKTDNFKSEINEVRNTAEAG